MWLAAFRILSVFFLSLSIPTNMAVCSKNDSRWWVRCPCSCLVTGFYSLLFHNKYSLLQGCVKLTLCSVDIGQTVRRYGDILLQLHSGISAARCWKTPTTRPLLSVSVTSVVSVRRWPRDRVTIGGGSSQRASERHIPPLSLAEKAGRLL